MSLEFLFERTGGPEVLVARPIPPRSPGEGEALVEQEAIGVNFLDVTHRNGGVPVPLPSGLGVEAAGRVAAIGPGVGNVAVGDRVAYALGPLGAYASQRVLPASRLIRIPDSLSCDHAAAVMLKGLTAQYLLKSTCPVKPGMNVVLYGAAGGLGQIMAQWARHLGARLIGVVSRQESVEAARLAGCHEVLVWGQCDLAAEVSRITGGALADVVYDGVGKATFDTSLDCLRVRGMMVSIGAQTGVPDPVDIRRLNRTSLFLTRPGLAAHITDPAEYAERALDLFAAIDSGIIRPAVWKTARLADAADVHRAMESGPTLGAIVLKP